MSKALKEYGFDQNYSDYSFSTLAKDGFRSQVLVYVDDLVVPGSPIEVINEFKAYSTSCFHIKNLGVLKYFLGVDVACSLAGIYLCPRKYALYIISETGVLGVRPCSFPLEQNHKLAIAKDTPSSDPCHYLWLVGKLIYLGTTRSELSMQSIYCHHSWQTRSMIIGMLPCELCGI